MFQLQSEHLKYGLILSNMLMLWKGRKLDPKSKSHETISRNCSDPLMPAKIAFFASVAKQITRFLTTFQTDKPMLPVMSLGMYTLLKSLLNRFVKSELVVEDGKQ